METANMALSARVADLEAAHAQLAAHKTSLTEQLRATTAQLTSALQVKQGSRLSRIRVSVGGSSRTGRGLMSRVMAEKD